MVKIKSFFITTAIDYPSGMPHMGHAYEKICADAIARFKRLRGFDVHFSTGTDEHGMKIERKAKKAGKTPQRFVDEMAVFFRRLCEALDISYDDFIRTTEPRHAKVAQEIFRRIYEKGEIYKGMYDGLYCVECETYYTAKDLVDGKCPVHGNEPEEVSEESYFFQMGKYRDRLVEHIKKHPDFIRPESKRNEILNRLHEPLKDLCVSRTSFDWGIPVPIDKKHVQYVWMDALINYLSTVGWPAGKSGKFWPADIHLIGKDIVWHHTVIWGSILMAAGVALPKTVYVHGFVNIKGEKMSKSRGAVVDPLELADAYGTDPLRYFLISEIPFGEDGDFSVGSLITRNNNELADNLGNLINRVLTFIHNKSAKKVPKPSRYDDLDRQLIQNLKVYTDNVGKLMDDLQLQEALDQLMMLAKFGNEYFQAKEPWGGDPANCLYLGANLVKCIAVMLEPFMPSSAERIWAFLRMPGSVHKQRWESAKELSVKAGHTIQKPAPLFKKFKI
ncbi:MAG: methionine--tRNA ligase [Candidatus Aenigmarchaeota archaeon]|nr:methionine--tRNA ligase [Candidatus Aenigmarchaeota archaeon]